MDLGKKLIKLNFMKLQIKLEIEDMYMYLSCYLKRYLSTSKIAAIKARNSVTWLITCLPIFNDYLASHCQRKEQTQRAKLTV